MTQTKGLRIYQCIDRWLLRAPSREICLQCTGGLLALGHDLGWVVNLESLELILQQIFNFVRYCFDLSRSLIKPTQERWEALMQEIHILLNYDAWSIRQFMSLLALLTATEKQVVSGRLHMRLIQWHLKNNWHVPDFGEAYSPIKIAPSSPEMLAQTVKCAAWPTFAPPSACPLTVYRFLKQQLMCTLRDCMARGLLSKPESHLHIIFLELKAVFLALKKFEYLC